MESILFISLSSIYHDGRINTYIQKLNEKDYNIFVISLKQDKNENSIEKKNYTNYKIVKRYIGDSKVGYFFSYLNFFIITFFLATYLTFKHKIKIIHYNNSPNFIIFSCILTKLFGVKLILDNHDVVPMMVQSKFDSRFLLFLSEFEQKLSMNFANKIICADDNQKDYLISKKIHESKITTILNIPGKNLIKFDIEKKDINLLKFVYHGTISYRLGIDLVIKAFNILKNEINIEFHLIGKGDFLKNIKELVKQFSLEDRIIIYDNFIPYNELSNTLSNMDVGIIGNRISNLANFMLPVKLLEYVSLGIPVIAPQNKIISRYFTEDMVCFYEPENVEDMASKIRYLYCNEEVRNSYAKKALKFSEQYNYSSEMAKYQSVIDKLLNKK